MSECVYIIKLVKQAGRVLLRGKLAIMAITSLALMAISSVIQIIHSITKNDHSPSIRRAQLYWI
jgi:hypothetical protein